jgi:hypothetical protein
MTACSLVCDIHVLKEHTASNFRVQINHFGKVAGYTDEGKQVKQKCSIRTMNAKKAEEWQTRNNGNTML